MIWYIRRNIFNYKTMAMMILRLDGPCRRVQSKGVPEGYCVHPVGRLDGVVEGRIKAAFSRMDIKQTFDIEQMKRRLMQGHSVYLIEDSARIIGWSWVGRGKVHFDEFGCVINVSANSGFVYNVYIDKSFRGKNLNHFVLDCVEKGMRQQGVEILWALVNWRNVRSIKSFERSGWTNIGSYRFLRILRWTMLRAPKGAL